MNLKMGYPESPREFLDTSEGDNAEARYKSRIEEVCAGLYVAVDRLSEIVEELEHRLRPVMGVEDDSPAGTKGSPFNPSDSPLVVSLDATAFRLQEIHARQLAILQRLQV